MEELTQQVRAAAFRQILASGHPAAIAGLVAATGTGEDEVRAAVDDLLAAGRARIDEHSNVAASAGLSVTPTRHRIQTQHGSRWTNCAYDALGILGALAADGEITSSSALTGRPIRVSFSNGQPGGSGGSPGQGDLTGPGPPGEPQASGRPGGISRLGGDRSGWLATRQRPAGKAAMGAGPVTAPMRTTRRPAGATARGSRSGASAMTSRQPARWPQRQPGQARRCDPSFSKPSANP